MVAHPDHEEDAARGDLAQLREMADVVEQDDVRGDRPQEPDGLAQVSGDSEHLHVALTSGGLLPSINMMFSGFRSR